MKTIEIEKKIEEYTDLLTKFLNMADELSGIKSRLYELNIENSYTELEKARAIIKAKAIKDFGENKVIDCFGDLFVINEDATCFNTNNGVQENSYIGRRLLLNGQLSKEKYEINEVAEFDNDGYYDYTDYEIKIKGE